MALKPARKIESWEVGYVYDSSATADQERGGVVALKTAGSGAALDDANAVVYYAANPSGAVAIGVLADDVRVIDPDKETLNPHKAEARAGQKVSIVRRGWVVTDRVVGSPSAGTAAYLGPTGYVQETQDPGAPRVGTFLSTKGPDGYIKVWIDCPAV